VKRALLALLFVATIAGAAWLVSKIPGGVGPLVAMARGIPATIWVGCVAAALAFYLLDYLRFYTLLRILGVRIGAFLGLELTCVSYFVSSLTPTADLHLPAMIFVLARHGVPPGDGAAASITKSVYQVTWIAVVALASLALSGLSLPPAVAASLWAAAVPLAAIVVAFGLIILFPEGSRRVTRRLAARPGVAGSIAAGVDRCAEALARLGRSTDAMHLLAHAASVAFVFVYVLIGWLLAQGVGLPLSFPRAIPVFSAGLLVAYLAPVPGSIGVTELATAYLLDPRLGPEALVVSGLLRVFCWYGVVLPGAALLAWEALRKSTRDLR
jgi:uncharacterized protein (TIRG00374 family)